MSPTEEDALPKSFDELVALLAPRAMIDERSYEAALDIVDRLMASGVLNTDQAAYLETLVELVEAYEALEHPVK